MKNNNLFLKSTACGLFLLLLLSLFFPPAVNAIVTSSEPPEIVYVDDDFNETTPGWGFDHFSTITDGVENVVVNGTVKVAEGIYFEHVRIEKSLHLMGENASTTIIDGSNTSETVFISESFVDISGFTIRNGSTGLVCVGFNIGVYRNIITNNYEWGITLSGIGSGHCLVTANTISNNGHDEPNGTGNGGIGLSVSFSNRISNNNFFNNSDSNAFFFKSIFNIWIMNYWDKPRLLPYPILGLQAIIPPLLWFQFDWRPRLTPYDINRP